MADVASKQQTTALFLSTIATRTRRYTELTNLCCFRERSVQFSSVFRAVFFTHLNFTVLLKVYEALYSICFAYSYAYVYANGQSVDREVSITNKLVTGRYGDRIPIRTKVCLVCSTSRRAVGLTKAAIKLTPEFFLS
jgi:hypothetical protein